MPRPCLQVQQMLAEPGCLERYIDGVDKLEAVRSIFTGLYSLDHVRGSSNLINFKNTITYITLLKSD